MAIDQTSPTIRLLILHAGAESDPVSCRIIQAKLESAPNYIAISYTWTTESGDSSKTKSISVHAEDGTTKNIIRVTTNCEVTLRQVRQVDQAKLVWIDSVCIAQSNISERNYQVSIMARIYAGASHVAICMQAPDQDLRHVMSIFEVDDVRDLVNSDWKPTMPEVSALFSMRYFSRVWVRLSPSEKISVTPANS